MITIISFYSFKVVVQLKNNVKQSLLIMEFFFFRFFSLRKIEFPEDNFSKWFCSQRQQRAACIIKTWRFDFVYLVLWRQCDRWGVIRYQVTVLSIICVYCSVLFRGDSTVHKNKKCILFCCVPWFFSWTAFVLPLWSQKSK